MLYSATYLRQSPDMSSDPFSDILRFAQAESLVTGGFTAGGPWALRFPAPDKIKFFAITRGACWVRLDGEAEPLYFGTGDVGLLTAKRAFVLASDLETPPMDAMSVFSSAARTPVVLGDGSDFAHLGGHVLLDPTSGRLLADALPPWIHVPASSPQATNFRWLLERLVAERGDALPGAQLASAQLAQLLFIQILRAHLKSASPMPAGWLRAMGDPRIAPALRLMHDDPANAWTLETLAQACAMSRSTFALHFRTIAGVTPLTYLAQWRMRLAERALRDGNTSVARIAQSLGYTSESAFSHAFKRLTGHSPRAARQSARALETADA